jgi:hypothetical protein
VLSLCFKWACLNVTIVLQYLLNLDLGGLGWNVHDAWCDVICRLRHSVYL